MYTSNDENYSVSKQKILVENMGHQKLKPTNQDSIKVPNVCI